MNTKAVYMIKCSGNNKFYIGQSKNVWVRYSTHLTCLRAGKSTSYLLQKCYNEFGESSLSLVILEFVSNQFDLTERERFYIKNLSPKLNTYIGFQNGIKKRKRYQY